MATKNQDAKKAEPNFESALERLESIVEKMESDKLPLEELLVRYEEGIKLVKFCSEKLQAAEKRIEIIARDAGGKSRLAEFDADEAEHAVALAPGTGSEAESETDSGDVRLF